MYIIKWINFPPIKYVQKLPQCHPKSNCVRLITKCPKISKISLRKTASFFCCSSKIQKYLKLLKFPVSTNESMVLCIIASNQKKPGLMSRSSNDSKWSMQENKTNILKEKRSNILILEQPFSNERVTSCCLWTSLLQTFQQSEKNRYLWAFQSVPGIHLVRCAALIPTSLSTRSTLGSQSSTTQLTNSYQRLFLLSSSAKKEFVSLFIFLFFTVRAFFLGSSSPQFTLTPKSDSKRGQEGTQKRQRKSPNLIG